MTQVSNLDHYIHPWFIPPPTTPILNSRVRSVYEKTRSCMLMWLSRGEAAVT